MLLPGGRPGRLELRDNRPERHEQEGQGELQQDGTEW